MHDPHSCWNTIKIFRELRYTIFSSGLLLWPLSVSVDV